MDKNINTIYALLHSSNYMVNLPVESISLAEFKEFLYG